MLVDFGIFQGRDATDAKNRNLGKINPRRLDAIVLTHAHLDHCGRLPILVKEVAGRRFIPRRHRLILLNLSSKMPPASRPPTWSE